MPSTAGTKGIKLLDNKSWSMSANRTIWVIVFNISMVYVLWGGIER